MAKKKLGFTPTGGMPGAERASESVLQTASSRLKQVLSERGINPAEFLKDEFGITSSSAVISFFTKQGKEVQFYEIAMNVDEVSAKTKVIQEINGREQETLSPERSADLASIKHHQYYPLIGCIEPDGTINILDGSRRRFRYLKERPNYQLRMLVTESELTPEEAEYFASDMQTAADKTIRDDGMKLLARRNELPDASYNELGAPWGWDKMAVTRRIQAAEIPADIILFFPIRMSVRQFTTLHKIVFDKFDGNTQEVIQTLEGADKRQPGEEDSDFANRLLGHLTNALRLPTKPKAQKTSILEGFNNKHRKAVKSVDSKGVTSFKFTGLREETIAEIESLIRKAIQGSE